MKIYKTYATSNKILPSGSLFNVGQLKTYPRISGSYYLYIFFNISRFPVDVFQYIIKSIINKLDTNHEYSVARLPFQINAGGDTRYKSENIDQLILKYAPLKTFEI